MSRLFSFGCSFTNYTWPTWADIAARNFDYFENWGQMGGGNSFIFYSLCEAIKRNSISKDDTVAVMWTSISREDRWIKSTGWLTVGSIYNQQVYDETFVKKYADPTGYLIRDLATISAARRVLDSIGCKWKFFSIVPLGYHDDSGDDSSCWFTLDQKVIELYKDDIGVIHPSVFEVVFNQNWYSRSGPVKLDNLEKKYNICRGKDWPSWEEFIVDRTENCSPDIKHEIQKIFGFEKDLIRNDLHPTPAEHSEYLQKVWPDLQLDRLWVDQINQKVLLGQDLKPIWFTKAVKRF